MKKYFALCLEGFKKFKCIAFFDPTTDILMVQKLEALSLAGGFQKDKLIKEIKIMKSNGFEILIETRNSSFKKIGSVIHLQDKGPDGRMWQEIAYEYLVNINESGCLNFDAGSQKSLIEAKIKQVKPSDRLENGRPVYNFDKMAGEMRVVLNLIILHYFPQKTMDYYLDIERAINNSPNELSGIDKRIHNVTFGYEEQLAADMEKRIKEAQKNFK